MHIETINEFDPSDALTKAVKYYALLPRTDPMVEVWERIIANLRAAVTNNPATCVRLTMTESEVLMGLLNDDVVMNAHPLRALDQRREEERNTRNREQHVGLSHLTIAGLHETDALVKIELSGNGQRLHALVHALTALPDKEVRLLVLVEGNLAFDWERTGERR